MVVSFTGTRDGMTQAQQDQLSFVLFMLYTPQMPGRPAALNEFHFGGAKGADRQARRLARQVGFDVHWHPCPGVAFYDIVADGDASRLELLDETWHEVFPPLVRNRHMADLCTLLVAAPRTDREEQRSGTWATVRYARQAGRPVVMLSRGRE